MPKHGSQWMARDGPLGDGAMDSSRWTARDRRLGDGAMEGLAMSRQLARDGAQLMARNKIIVLCNDVQELKH